MSQSGATTTQTSGVPEQFLPYISGYLNSASQVAQLPYQQYPGQRVADLSPLQQQSLQGFSGLNNAALPYLGNAANTLGQLSTGSMNPYTQQVADTVTRDATRAYNNATSNITQRYNTTGNFGGVRNQMAQDLANEDLARGLSSGLGNVYSNAYDTTQQRALQAAQGLSGLYNTAVGGLTQQLTAGDIPRQQNQSLLDSLFNEWQTAYHYPETQLGIYGNALGRLSGGAMGNTSTTTGPGRDPVATGIGTLALANMLSRGNGGSGKSAS